MSERGDTADSAERRTPSGETPWERRRRLDAVFGDVLPDTTADEREPGESPRSGDDWLRAQVPPHHGG
jgi:hypothetical protein